MSYSVNGFGSYYAMQGFGAYGLGAAAAAAFDPAAVYSDWLQQTTPAANAAVRQIQAGLNSLHFGPVTVDGSWGSGSSAAFRAFALANGVSTIPDCPGSPPNVTPALPGSCPTKDGIAKMAELLGSSKHAGVGMMVGIGLAGAALVVGLVMASKRKHGHFREVRY